MKRYHISKLFDREGLVIENSNSLKISEINSKDIISSFEKYGIIIFKGFDFKKINLTFFTDIFTKTYSTDALRRPTRFGKKNITSVDYGFSEIDLHSEASFAPSWPEIIWFYCITPTTGEGGATTLCDGSVLWKKLSTKAKTFFLTNPIIYKLKIPIPNKKLGKGKRPWPIENPAASDCFIDWDSSTINLTLSRFAVQKRRDPNVLCFANHLLSIDAEDQIISGTVKNNQKIPDKFIKEIINKSEDLTYEYYWEKNDLMMIDNRRFMHARRSFNKNDPRDIINIQTARASFGYKLTEKVFKNNKT